MFYMLDFLLEDIEMQINHIYKYRGGKYSLWI